MSAFLAYCSCMFYASYICFMHFEKLWLFNKSINQTGIFVKFWKNRKGFRHYWNEKNLFEFYVFLDKNCYLGVLGLVLGTLCTSIGSLPNFFFICYNVALNRFYHVFMSQLKKFLQTTIPEPGLDVNDLKTNFFQW